MAVGSVFFESCVELHVLMHTFKRVHGKWRSQHKHTAWQGKQDMCIVFTRRDQYRARSILGVVVLLMLVDFWTPCHLCLNACVCRDILLKRDSVSTLQRRMYAQRLAASGGEGAELPPSALVAPLTLSPAEREQIVSQLDSALVAGDVEGYRCMAEALYRDGLISATDLLSCLAAASAAVEEAAADRLAADAVAADSPGGCWDAVWSIAPAVSPFTGVRLFRGFSLAAIMALLLFSPIHYLH